jgi:hypothetical protein
MCVQRFLFLHEVHKTLNISWRKYAVKVSPTSSFCPHAQSSVVFAPVGRPHSQTFHFLDNQTLLQFLLYLKNHLLIVASVEEENHGLFDDGNSGVNGHEWKQIGTNWVCNLPISPDMTFGGKKVDYTCWYDHSNWKDDISEDVNVGGFDINVIMESFRGMLLSQLYLFIWCRTVKSDVILQQTIGGVVVLF